MEKTDFAGLTALDAGESLTTDGGSFLARNPHIIDHYLRIGALLHRHNGAPALAGPAAAPTVTAATTGGQLPADTAVVVGYTLVDGLGGETVLSPPVTITTPPALAPPVDGPTAVVEYGSGQLVVDTYGYVVTLVDAAGAETPPSAVTEALREPGQANARVRVSGLAAIVAATPGAVRYRLYRAKGAGSFDLLHEGTEAEFVDDGTAPCNCNQNPPRDNRTNGTSRLQVTIPTAAVAGAAGFRIYVTASGAFVSPALLGATRAPAEAGTAVDLTTLEFADGAPPDVATTVAGASKIDPDTELLNFSWKGPVATVAALPTGGNAANDVRLVTATLTFYVWTGAAWEATAGGGGAAPAGLPTRRSRGSSAAALDVNGRLVTEWDFGCSAAMILGLQVNAAARVRIYADRASRDADLARAVIDDPAATVALVLEYVLAAAGDAFITPAAFFFNRLLTAGEPNLAYVTVDSVAAGTTTLNASATFTPMEAAA